MGDLQGHDGNEAKVALPFDPPKCHRCQDSAGEMYLTDYEAMRTAGAPAICAECREEEIKIARIRSGAGGFQLGI